jgi:hypothetical protein
MSDTEQGGCIAKAIGPSGAGGRTRRACASFPDLPHDGRRHPAVPAALGADGRRQRGVAAGGRRRPVRTAAADRTPIREIVGEDPVEFVEALVGNYEKGG